MAAKTTPDSTMAGQYEWLTEMSINPTNGNIYSVGEKTGGNVSVSGITVHSENGDLIEDISLATAGFVPRDIAVLANGKIFCIDDVNGVGVLLNADGTIDSTADYNADGNALNSHCCAVGNTVYAAVETAPIAD